MNFDTRPVSAGLHLVATPIGAARDITLRALDLLAGATVLAAEDTRTLRRLMEIHGVPLSGRRIIAYHDHSGAETRTRLLGPIRDGGSVAYVSEAGTPLLADPGFALARAAVAEDLPVFAAPGASALLAALVVAGLPTDRFAFAGFLPAATRQRETALADLRALPMTLVLYESPKRVHGLLVSLREVLGAERQAAVCRELTKKFEEVTRGTLEQLAAAFDGRDVKGEVVVVIGGSSGTSEADAGAVEAALAEAMAGMRLKDAATAVAGAFGLPRRDVYQLALDLQSRDTATGES